MTYRNAALEAELAQARVARRRRATTADPTATESHRWIWIAAGVAAAVFGVLFF